MHVELKKINDISISQVLVSWVNKISQPRNDCGTYVLHNPLPSMNHHQSNGSTAQKDKDRSIGKGRRFSLFNSLPRKLFCTRTIFNNWTNSFFSSHHPDAIHPFIVLVHNSQRGKELKKFCPLNKSYNLYLCFCLYPFSMEYTGIL